MRAAGYDVLPEGQPLRLRPSALGRRGETADDDWNLVLHGTDETLSEVHPVLVPSWPLALAVVVCVRRAASRSPAPPADVKSQEGFVVRAG